MTDNLVPREAMQAVIRTHMRSGAATGQVNIPDILEAAAPYIAAAVLESIANRIDDEWYGIDEVTVRDMLRDEARGLRGRNADSW